MLLTAFSDTQTFSLADLICLSSNNQVIVEASVYFVFLDGLNYRGAHHDFQPDDNEHTTGVSVFPHVVGDDNRLYSFSLRWKMRLKKYDRVDLEFLFRDK